MQPCHYDRTRFPVIRCSWTPQKLCVNVNELQGARVIRRMWVNGPEMKSQTGPDGSLKTISDTL